MDVSTIIGILNKGDTYELNSSMNFPIQYSSIKITSYDTHNKEPSSVQFSVSHTCLTSVDITTFLLPKLERSLDGCIIHLKVEREDARNGTIYLTAFTSIPTVPNWGELRFKILTCMQENNWSFPEFCFMIGFPFGGSFYTFFETTPCENVQKKLDACLKYGRRSDMHRFNDDRLKQKQKEFSWYEKNKHLFITLEQKGFSKKPLSYNIYPSNVNVICVSFNAQTYKDDPEHPRTKEFNDLVRSTIVMDENFTTCEFGQLFLL